LTRLIKLIISTILFLGDRIRQLFRHVSGKIVPGECVTIYYHSVPPEQQQRFARQLDVLQRNTIVLSLGRPVNLLPGTHSVVITFDDAFENFAVCAVPELEKRSLPATVFVITDALDRSFGPAESFEKVMSAQQLKALPADLITVGSHTETHPMLPNICREAAYREIVGSKQKLEALLGRGIDLFSFPFGGFNSEAVALCKEAGYRQVFSTLPYLAFRESNEFLVGRVRVDPTDWPLEFYLKFAGAYRWLPLAFRLKRILLNRVTKQGMTSDPASYDETPKSAIREPSSSEQRVS
jgi:peptidoglycan/xylan/chitin deacetylase (PgdA/CDA1 family)